ncbi:response regulator [Pedobacter sp. HMF7647]|uniref:Response regulator n=1 Tax=Hufsiella arboris TaxID=2695275 RepID=A0A7K1Y8T4_9SPHI|nr:response regulator [Hufsiella arboris]MXV51013.1 response regulator [Hufsiella arboris]
MNEAVNILIVEDEGILAMGLEESLQADGYTVVGIVDNGPEALEVIKSQGIDLVLLDIHIKGDWDGIETARKISVVKEIPFIYLTAFGDKNTIDRAKDTMPAAYLTKPYQPANLRIAIEMALHQFAVRKSKEAKVVSIDAPKVKEPGNETILYFNDAVFVKQNYRFVKILLSDVYYLEADSNHTYIHTSDKKYALRNSLQHVLEKFSHPQFVRVHRSYAINLNRLQTFNDYSIILGPYDIPLGRNYKEEFFRNFSFL